MSTIRELAEVLQSGARATKYRVAFSFPSAVTGVTDLSDVDVLAKASMAPQKEIGMLEVYNQGRKLVMPGDTAFDNAWTVDFYLTEDHSLRIDLIKWMDACDNFQENKHSGNPLEIYADLRIEQLDSAGEVTAQYTLHNAWPQVMGEITYADDSTDTIAEFTVTFAYTDWVIGTGETSDYTVKTSTKNATALS